MSKENIQYIWSDRKRLTLFGLPWTFTKYALTKDKFLLSKGVFTLHFDEVRLYRIVDISLTQTFLQRIFGLGTISVISNDKSLDDFEIKNIKDPFMVKELLSEQIELERVKKRVTSREYMDSDNEFDDE